MSRLPGPWAAFCVAPVQAPLALRVVAVLQPQEGSQPGRVQVPVLATLLAQPQGRALGLVRQEPALAQVLAQQVLAQVQELA
jgi:hypothetical protein